MDLDHELPLLERQRLAAERTTELRRQATATKVRAACRRLQSEGKALALAAIARVAGISRQTVASYKYVLEEVATPVVVTSLEVAAAVRSAVKFGVHQVPAPSGAGLPQSGVFPAGEGSRVVGSSRDPPS